MRRQGTGMKEKCRQNVLPQKEGYDILIPSSEIKEDLRNA